MAFYITIKKISETNDTVIYEYFDEQTGKGQLQLAKESGDVAEVMPAPGDSSGRRFQRAAMKVVQHWKAGEFPDETCWAS
jgi:hypothetical protein